MKSSIKTNLLKIEIIAFSLLLFSLGATFYFFPGYYQDKKLTELDTYIENTAPDKNQQDNLSWMLQNGYNVQVITENGEALQGEIITNTGEVIQFEQINQTDEMEDGVATFLLPEVQFRTINIDTVGDGEFKLKISVDQETVIDVAGEIGIILFDLFIIFSIAGFIFFWYISRKIVDPVLKIHASVREISEFNFDNKLTLKGNDEIAMLANEINNLSVELESYLTQRTTLVQSLAHELKNPIAVIESSIDLYQHGVPPYNDVNYISNIIQESSEKMKEIVNFSLKVFSAKPNEKNENVNVTVVIRKFLAENKARANKNKVKFNIPKKDIYIKGNAQFLTIVVINLMDNAIKYSKRGTTVKISCNEHELLIVENEIGKILKGTQKGLEVSQDLLKQNNLQLDFETEDRHFIAKISKMNSK